MVLCCLVFNIPKNGNLTVWAAFFFWCLTAIAVHKFFSVGYSVKLAHLKTFSGAKNIKCQRGLKCEFSLMDT